MIWIVLAALGIPLWMVAGALVTTLLSRRKFRQTPGAFPAKLRVVSGEVAGLRSSFPRGQLAARWVHDVLVIHRGLALARSDALGVAQATRAPTTVGDDEVRGLGAEPKAMTLLLDSGASVELAAPANTADAMVGPFVGLLVAADEQAPPSVRGDQ
jgi:hypothetical protein